MHDCDNGPMDKIKRITANLPAELVEEATAVTGMNLTDTLIRGLHLIKRTAAYDRAQKLKGKLKLKIDLETSRERPRR
jgi:hypothetical protein